MRVPLAIADPRARARAGQAEPALVMNIDFMPTVLALAGAQAPGGTKVDGMSLLPLLQPGASWPRKGEVDGTVTDLRARLVRLKAQ